MRAEDITNTIDTAIAFSGVNEKSMPRLLSDNGSCYISHELADYIGKNNMKHIRGRP
jgi:transposase InsO family protein